MKTALILSLFVVFSFAGFAHIKGPYEAPDAQGPLIELSLPITKGAQLAIGEILVHLSCDLKKFFLMSGIEIPKGGKCRLEKERKSIELSLDRPNMEVALMLIGDLMLRCEDKTFLKAQILERYAFEGDIEESWLGVWAEKD